MDYKFTKEMGNITPLDGEYEELARVMFTYGVSFMNDNRSYDFDFVEEGDFIFPATDAARTVERLIFHVSRYAASPSLMQIVIRELVAYKRLGWKRYVVIKLQQKKTEEIKNEHGKTINGIGNRKRKGSDKKNLRTLTGR